MTNSHILINQFDYLEPTSVEHAVALLAERGKNARILAGGTDLIVQMKMERVKPTTLVSINRIPGLDHIASGDGQLRIGARATIAAIERDPRVRHDYACLAEACASFSTTQVQVMGTVGGNLGNGSPAADCAPALIALGAAVEVTGPNGKRCLPLVNLFVGPGRTALENGELITDLILPHPQPGTGSAFFKIGRVAADIAKASGAVTIVRDGDRVVECRMAFGSVAPTPVRTLAAERTLIGREFSEDLADEAADVAASEVAPIDDVRSQAWYRRDVVRALASEALNRAWQRAEAGEAGHAGHAEAGRHRASAPPQPAAHPLHAGEKRWIELTINGEKRQVWVGANDLLLNVLREQLQLTGSKYGCGIGECSACTVQVDGQPALSCLVLAVSAVGREILTVEGLRKPDGQLAPLQHAFLDTAAYQCGYCTPGMLMTAKSLLAERPHPDEGEVRHYLRGNLCRCTGYARIVRAVLNCAEGATIGQ